MQRSRRRRRWPWIVAGVIALLVIAFFILRGRNAGPAVEGDERETVTAFVGDLSANATASGNVVAGREARLALELSGIVQDVTVIVGDEVNEGDLLVALDDVDFALNVANAEQSLAVQEANLAALLEPAGSADLASAQAALASAEANLLELQSGPSTEEIAAAEANLRAAEASVERAERQLAQAVAGPSAAQVASARADVAAAEAQQYSAQLINQDNPNFETDQALQAASDSLAIAQARLANLLATGNAGSIAAAQAGIESAIVQRDIAQNNLDNLLSGTSEAQVAAAEAQVAQAAASVANLLESSSSAQIAGAEAQVEQARIALADAAAALANTRLEAPFSGTVTAVHVTEGEFASGVAIEILDHNSLQVVVQVDEIDIGALALGQEALVTLEPWADTEIVSEIEFIAPTATSSNSTLVTYEVRIGLGDIALPIRAGMTANASLITANREDVLLLANRAISVDRDFGTYTVNIVRQGEDGVEYEEVEVFVGLRDTQYSQIIDGLVEGDEILVGEPPRLQFGPGADDGDDDGPFN